MRRCPMPQRNTFSREFKLGAIRLVEQSDKPVTPVARELGLALLHLPTRYIEEIAL